MINVTEEIYRQLAEKLIEQIEELNGDFYNGSIELDTEEYYSELKCSLIIFRNKSCSNDCTSNEGSCSGTNEIDKVVPVWWEYALFTQQGQQDNTFSWREFITYITPYTSC